MGERPGPPRDRPLKAREHGGRRLSSPFFVHLGIHRVGQLYAFEAGDEIVGRHLCHLFARGVGAAAEMGHDETVGMRKQRMIDRQGSRIRRKGRIYDAEEH